MPPSTALHSFCHRVRVSAVAFSAHRSRQGVVPSTKVHLNQMASAVLAATSENVPQVDANPAPAKAPRIEYFKVKRIHADAVLPKRGSDRAAGYDLSRYGLANALSSLSNANETAHRLLHGAM
jgi:hypothetical protein